MHLVTPMQCLKNNFYIVENLSKKTNNLSNKTINIMSTEELKLQIFRQVDALDASKLKEFYGLMLNYINSSKDITEWLSVTESEKQGIEDAIKELNDGKGITHEQVMTTIKSKYNHA
jgi:hypothetical protein